VIFRKAGVQSNIGFYNSDRKLGIIELILCFLNQITVFNFKNINFKNLDILKKKL